MGAIKQHKVKIPHQVLLGIRKAYQIDSNLKDTKDIKDIAYVLFRLNETLAMFWVWLHKEEYLLGLENGFKGVRGLKSKELLTKFNKKYNDIRD